MPLACVKKEASTSSPMLSDSRLNSPKSSSHPFQPRPTNSHTCSPFQSPTPKLPKPTSRSPSTTDFWTSSEPWHPISTDSPRLNQEQSDLRPLQTGSSNISM